MNKHLIILTIALVTGLLQACRTPRAEQKIDLSGEWQFAMDPLDEGLTGQWFLQPFAESVRLPGSMTTNGKGFDVDIHTRWTGQVVDSSFFTHEKYARYRDPVNFKVPFWLQPVKHYVGAAWYRKEIDLPASWDGQHAALYLERCHWETRLWVNGVEAGMRNSLATPHVYDVSEFVRPGKNTIVICVDNRIKDIDPGFNSHSISDHTQSNWNGIVGEMHLTARPVIHIANLHLFPETARERVKVQADIVNGTSSSAVIKLELTARGATKPRRLVKEISLEPGKNSVVIDYPMGSGFALWDEFSPNLYTMTARLSHDGPGRDDQRSSRFGMRDFKAEGRQLTINGRPIFLRGTLECAIFPKTGYPPTDVESWRRIYRICKAHGLNHMRFHSWCPPGAAFEAADMEGFYLQPEASTWPNQSTTLGDGKPIDRYLYEETERIMEHYGNHPSFVMMASGNEPGGPHQGEFLTQYVTHWQREDPRRLYVAAAGWPNLEVNDFHNDPNPRIQRWGEGLNSIINREAPRSDYDHADYIVRYPQQPVVSHEIGQWCVYPNFKEIPKYDGVLKARNFEIFQETLQEAGMGHLADSFLLASGKLQALCYKADIEAALRTKDFGGFQLLDLHDFPGQGTALIGVLDAFWDEKGYISPKEFSRFCNTTVPLVRLPKHIYTNNEIFIAPAEIAHFGRSPMNAITPGWRVFDRHGQEVLAGELATVDINLGNGFALGNITFPLQQFTEPAALTLELTAGEYSNDWDFWVYPAQRKEIEGAGQIPVVQDAEAALKFLSEGETVLLHLKKGTLSPDMGGGIATGFSSIFWNTAWTRGQAPHTLGILCNPEHPALAEFPTQYHSNWQWWDAMSHSGAIILSTFPSEMKPIVRVIDDWFTNRPLGLILEARVGEGKLMLSGIDFSTNIENRQEAQQLLYSLKKYMAGEQFIPKTEISPEQLRRLTAN